MPMRSDDRMTVPPAVEPQKWSLSAFKKLRRHLKMVRLTLVRAASSLLISAFIAMQIAPATASPSQRSMAIGTFTSLEYNDESGDLNGVEVRIAPANGRLQAVVQVAEGGPGSFSVVPVSIRGNDIEFDVPLTKNVVGKFRGRITRNALVGKINWPTAAEPVRLRRGMSYWDR